jgi:nucleoside-diphosphate-sugar epimerase
MQSSKQSLCVLAFSPLAFSGARSQNSERQKVMGAVMKGTIFLAGGAGVIGTRLAPLLVAKEWRVVATTRSATKALTFQKQGLEAAIVNVFDASALTSAIVKARPQIIIHQLTDLPPGLDPARMAEATERNARIRDEGTRNLVHAGLEAGIERFIAQSVAFVYADGPLPHREDDPLAVDADGRAGVSARGVASLEQQVLSASFTGIVLRYGRLYGPGTGFDVPDGAAPLHVDAAARVAALVVNHGVAGTYNIAEADGTVSCDKAERLLGWSAD